VKFFRTLQSPDSEVPPDLAADVVIHCTRDEFETLARLVKRGKPRSAATTDVADQLSAAHTELFPPEPKA
jgi:hypothetical protein